MAYSIDLTPSQPSRVILTGRDVFRVRIVASNAVNLPNEIFGYQRTITDYLTNDTCDEFCFICSAFDISIYPANDPNPSQSPQFFRKDTIDVLLPSVTVADAFIAAVEDQVQTLLNVLDAMDEMSELTVVHLSAGDSDDSSESE